MYILLQYGQYCCPREGKGQMEGNEVNMQINIRCGLKFRYLNNTCK